MVGFLCFTAGALAIAHVNGASGSPVGEQVAEQAETQRELARARLYADRLEDVVARQVTRAEHNERKLRKARRVFRQSLRASPVGAHPFETAFACIHRYEGAWTAATGNGYYGGLQMDMSFQRAYGGWALQAFGPANRWPVSVQMSVAIRALTSGRGFAPWPNTARLCGLI